MPVEGFPALLSGMLGIYNKKASVIFRDFLSFTIYDHFLHSRISPAGNFNKRLVEIQITKEATGISPDEKRKIEAVIYIMADKFLSTSEMEEIKEVLSMTKLGQMLVNDGIRQGIQKGIQKGIRKGAEDARLDIARNLLDVLDEQSIAEHTGLSLKTVQQLKDNHE